MQTWQRAWAVALVLTAMHAGPSFADDAVEPAALPPVLVPLPPDDPAPEAPARRDPTAPVTIIDARERSAEAHAASELISEAPGVIVQDRGGLLQSRSLVLRGASSSGVLVLLDGIPLNGAGGMVDLGRIPLAIVDHFEVLRGAGTQYSTGALGGVVNVVTRKPGHGGLLAGGATYGSFGTALANLSATGALLGGHGLLVLHGGRTSGAFSYPFDDQPNFDGNALVEQTRQNNAVTMGGGMLRFRRALDADRYLDASLELAIDDRGLAGTAQNPTPTATQAAQRLTSSVRGAQKLDHGELALRAWGRTDRTSLRGGFFGDGVDQRELGAGAELTAQWLVADAHGLSTSAEVAYDGLIEPTGRNPSWVRAGIAASDEWLLFDGALSIVPSMRVDQTGPFTTLSPKLGASYALPAGFTVRANVGQAHRAPSFLELYVVQGTLLPNPDLRPERALTGDATVEHRSRTTTVALTAFHSLYEDLIAYEYYPPLLARPYNFAAARVQGAEAEGQWRPSRYFDAGASYTLTFSSNLRDDPRYYLKDLPYRPRHRLVAHASGGVDRARLRGEVDLQSEQYMNRTNTLSLPGRALLNLGVTARVFERPNVALALDVKNLLDVQSSDFAGYPLPGRSAYLTLSFSLDPSPTASPGEDAP